MTLNEFEWRRVQNGEAIIWDGYILGANILTIQIHDGQPNVWIHHERNWGLKLPPVGGKLWPKTIPALKKAAEKAYWVWLKDEEQEGKK